MRQILATLMLSVCAASSAVAATPEGWPTLFREAALPKSADAPVAYDVEVTFDEASDDENDNGVLAYSIQAPLDGKRVVELRSVPESMKREDLLKDLEEPDSDIWCDDYRDVVGGDVVLKSETDTTATFAFPANPDMSEDKQERKIMKKVEITVEVDKTAKRILNFRYALTEPVKPMVIAKVNAFELSGQCDAAAGIRPVVTSVATSVSGSAMGKDFNQHTTQTISNVRLLD